MQTNGCPQRCNNTPKRLTPGLTPFFLRKDRDKPRKGVKLFISTRWLLIMLVFKVHAVAYQIKYKPQSHGLYTYAGLDVHFCLHEKITVIHRI